MYLRRSRLIAHTHPLPLAPPRHGLPYACLLDDIPKTLFYHTESLLKTSQWHPIAVTVSIGELQGSVNSLKYLNNFECIKFCVFFWGVKNYSLHQILKKKEYLFQRMKSRPLSFPYVILYKCQCISLICHYFSKTTVSSSQVSLLIVTHCMSCSSAIPS